MAVFDRTGPDGPFQKGEKPMATDNRDPRRRTDGQRSSQQRTGVTRSTNAQGSTVRRRKKKKSPLKRFVDEHFTLCLIVMLAVLALLIVLIVHSMKGGNDDKTPTKNSPTQAPTETVDKPTATPTTAAEPTATPEPTETPTPTLTPTPYVFGLCSSVTLDQDSEPVEGDNWEIDYLMLVNWSHRLKYTGNPENLVRLNEVLTADFYTIEEPYTVSESKRNFVIENEEDKYDRGNRVAVEHLNEMCTDFHNATGIGIKVSQTGAYRNYATQDRFWQNRDKSINPPRTIPGNASEHRTGLGFDIWVLDSGENDTTWFRNNCYKYGFILRYPSDKKKITGIAYEQWHFRYVGAEAAKEIFDLGYCLEEYIAYKNGEDLSSLPQY